MASHKVEDYMIFKRRKHESFVVMHIKSHKGMKLLLTTLVRRV